MDSHDSQIGQDALPDLSHGSGGGPDPSATAQQQYAEMCWYQQGDSAAPVHNAAAQEITMQGYSPFVPPPPTPMPAISAWQSPMLHQCSNPFLPSAPAATCNMQAAAGAPAAVSFAPFASTTASGPPAVAPDGSTPALVLQAQLEAERSRTSLLATQLELAELRAAHAELRATGATPATGAHAASAPSAGLAAAFGTPAMRPAFSLAGSVGASGTIDTIPNLPSATSRSMPLDMEHSAIPSWIRVFKSRCSSHHALVAALLRMPVGYAPSSREELIADAWLASAFLDCLDHKAVRVRNFLEELSAAQLASGTALLSAAEKLPTFSLGSERRAAELAFERDRPFRHGLGEPETQRAASDLVQKFKRLPAYSADDKLCVRLMLIRKMPSDSEEDKKKKNDLEDKLHEAEIMGKPDGPWTQAQLVKIIAMHLEKGGAQANAAERERRERERRDLDDFKNCLNCGKPGHRSRDCKAKCSVCSLTFCPGTHSGASLCVLAQPTFPGEVLNAAQRPVARVIRQKLQAKHKEKYGAPDTAAAEQKESKQGENEQGEPATSAAESPLHGAVAPADIGTEGPRLQSHVAFAPGRALARAADPSDRSARKAARTSSDRAAAELKSAREALAAAEAEKAQMRSLLTRHGIVHPFDRQQTRA